MDKRGGSFFGVFFSIYSSLQGWPDLGDNFLLPEFLLRLLEILPWIRLQEGPRDPSQVGGRHPHHHSSFHASCADSTSIHFHQHSHVHTGAAAGPTILKVTNRLPCLKQNFILQAPAYVVAADENIIEAR